MQADSQVRRKGRAVQAWMEDRSKDVFALFGDEEEKVLSWSWVLSQDDRVRGEQRLDRIVIGR